VSRGEGFSNLSTSLCASNAKTNKPYGVRGKYNSNNEKRLNQIKKLETENI
jgi:hypothetical protein